jgi:hypothetical protein
MAVFCFVFASFHFRFASDFCVSHRCETSEKGTFFASKRKKFRFRFALHNLDCFPLSSRSQPAFHLPLECPLLSTYIPSELGLLFSDLKNVSCFPTSSKTRLRSSKAQFAFLPEAKASRLLFNRFFIFILCRSGDSLCCLCNISSNAGIYFLVL